MAEGDRPCAPSRYVALKPDLHVPTPSRAFSHKVVDDQDAGEEDGTAAEDQEVAEKKPGNRR